MSKKGWELYDAMGTATAAREEARDLRTPKGRIYKDYMTEAVVEDMGADAGRLRYGVLVRRGRHI